MVDRVVMELWYCTVWSRTLHSGDEDKVDLKRLKLYYLEMFVDLY